MPLSAADPTDVAPKRLAAAAIDFLPVAVLNIGFSIVSPSTSSFVSNDGTFSSSQTNINFFGANGLITLVSLAWLVGSCVVARGVTGASIGQMALGLVTVTEDGKVLGVPMAFARSLLGIVDGFPYCCYLFLVGGITMFTTKGHRRVADIVVKSFVVPKDHLGQRVVVPGLNDAATGPWAVPTQVDPFAAPTQLGGAAAQAEPQWDAQRNTWIRWDGTRWWAWDAVSNQWTPLS